MCYGGNCKATRCSPSSFLTGLNKSPMWKHTQVHFNKVITDFNPRQFKTPVYPTLGTHAFNEGLTHIRHNFSKPSKSIWCLKNAPQCQSQSPAGSLQILFFFNFFTAGGSENVIYHGKTAQWFPDVFN